TADTGYFDTTPALTEDGLRELVGRLLTPLVARYGDEVVEGFHQGFEDAARFAALWETDMVEQVTWADNIQEYQDKAIRIDKYLSDNNIVVDLDTFVESNEETSTTHVHNEHRLVMIESGQMHFWNNVTHKIEFNQGDKVLIPVSRLHGST
ncbi:peptide synthetase, partial [Streptomyces sp. SID7499]|nr:peptide synthetase [Streptomyces sp. SID7499]